MQNYILKHGTQSFYAVEATNIILVGGIKRGCVEIEIRKRGKNIEGYLQLAYDHRCNTSGDLARGVGTLAMMRVAITFAFSKVPKMQAIFLKDHSEVPCGSHALYLPPVQLAEHGKTWYMRHVQATPLEKSDQDALEKFVLSCTANLPASFEVFYVNHMKLRRDIPPIPKYKQRLKKYWNMSTSLRSFITAIKTANECELYMHWLRDYYTSVSAKNIESMDFVIRRGAFHAVEIAVHNTDEPYTDYLRERQRKLQRQKDIFDKYIMKSGGRRRHLVVM